ncbi:transcriptional regulator [Fictibacillus macauensis ZFHKF-1]|uniref:Transcriptional regulator n=1 Tax=Fictibacillus macauensis ZFHKF-1 TaxID=1196324 RepID=I8UKQ6_9BACL|nr:tetratricopeptide repeat protein [Fictibacillus macauensis]EIT87413.1 transcriptional regulator [Fictibacillus macauensis ZFHKF-1]
MVGQRIRYYRKTKGLTQEELAQGICSVSYLSKIEKGDARSSDEVLNLLCKRLGISPEEEDTDEILGLLDEWNLLMVNRHTEVAAEMFKSIREKINNTHNPEIILRYKIFQMRYYLIPQNRDLDIVDKNIQEIEKTFEHLTPELVFFYYTCKTIYFSEKGNHVQGLELALKAEAISKEVKVRSAFLGHLFYLIAYCYSYLSAISPVHTYAFKALSIFDSEYLYSRSADCQILIGISFRRANNFDEAEYHYNQALKYALQFKDKFISSVIYHNLGLVYSCKMEHEKAIKLYEKVLETRNQSDYNTAPTYFLIASAYFKLNQFDDCQTYITKGLENIKDTKNNPHFFHLKLLEYRLGSFEFEDFEHFMTKNAIPFFQQNNHWEFTSEFCEVLADWYFEQSQYKKASTYYRIANSSRKHIV